MTNWYPWCNQYGTTPEEYIFNRAKAVITQSDVDKAIKQYKEQYGAPPKQVASCLDFELPEGVELVEHNGVLKFEVWLSEERMPAPRINGSAGPAALIVEAKSVSIKEELVSKEALDLQKTAAPVKPLIKLPTLKTVSAAANPSPDAVRQKSSDVTPPTGEDVPATLKTSDPPVKIAPESDNVSLIELNEAIEAMLHNSLIIIKRLYGHQRGRPLKVGAVSRITSWRRAKKQQGMLI